MKTMRTISSFICTGHVGSYLVSTIRHDIETELAAGLAVLLVGYPTMNSVVLSVIMLNIVAERVKNRAQIAL